MNRRRVLLCALCLASVALVTVACGSAPASAPGSAPASSPIPSTAVPAGSSADQTVLVAAQCVLYHSGYEGITVASKILKPTKGTAVSLECNGKKIELADKTIVDGNVETKDFGKIGIRFASMITTVGAGDYTSVKEGFSLPEQVIQLYVQAAKQKDFAAAIAK